MLTATVSHEMRTPINAISVQLDILSDFLKDKKSLRMVKTIRNSAQLLLFLVNDLLDIYMLKNGKLQPISTKFKLTHFKKEILSMFSIQMQGKNLNFEFDLDQSVPYKI